MNEIKSARFKRLAEKRTNRVIKRLKVLGNCANRYAYEYTKEDADKIFKAIEETLEKVKSKFYMETSAEKEFKL